MLLTCTPTPPPAGTFLKEEETEVETLDGEPENA